MWVDLSGDDQSYEIANVTGNDSPATEIGSITKITKEKDNRECQ
jgi:hypothetical protein